MNKVLKELRKIRKEKGIKQKAAAKSLGITPTTLSRYETGQREMGSDLLERYAILLGHKQKLERELD